MSLKIEEVRLPSKPEYLIYTIAVGKMEDRETVTIKHICEEMLEELIIPITIITDTENEMFKEMVLNNPDKRITLTAIAIGMKYLKNFEA